MTTSTTVASKNVYPTIQSDRGYMPALTGIRAVAAYMVCFFHYNPIKQIPHTHGWRQLAYNFFNELHTGVTIFFVLSGFLICYRYYDTTTRITGSWFKRYFLNRFARIYPMFFLVTLLTFYLTEKDPAWYEAVPVYRDALSSERLAIFGLNLTLLKGFFNDYKFTGVAQSWSLTVEECFYACAPFFIIYFKRSRWAFAVLPAFTLFIALCLWQTLGRLHYHGLFDNSFFILNFTFFGRCLEFFAGMGLAVFMLRQRHKMGGIIPTRRGGWITSVSIILFIVATIAMAVIHSHLNLIQTSQEIDLNGHSKDTYLGIAINNIVLPLIVSMLFYGLLTERTWFRSLLSTKLLDLLGKSSYIFYLIHMGVINAIIRAYPGHNSIMQFAILNLLSIILYKFIESPIHRWLKPA